MNSPQPPKAETSTASRPTKSPRKQLDEMIGKICLDWWANLNGLDAKTGQDKEGMRADRGSIAGLRRIGTIEGPHGEEVDTAFAVSISSFTGAPPYLALHRRLKSAFSTRSEAHVRRFAERPEFDAAVAVVAATLARAREHKNGEVAALLGARTREEAPLMAEARFKRLIRTTTAPDLLDQGRRIVMLLWRAVPIGGLGASLLLWNLDPYVKRRWSFSYYGADDFSPETSDREADGDASSADNS